MSNKVFEAQFALLTAEVVRLRLIESVREDLVAAKDATSIEQMREYVLSAERKVADQIHLYGRPQLPSLPHLAVEASR